MSKVTLNTIGDITQSTTAQNTINADLTIIQTAFDNTLSRDGTSPNTMNANLDMNNNKILNLPTPTNPTDPLRLQDLTSLQVVNKGTVSTPGSTTAGHVATWGDTTGTTLVDGGVVASVSSPVTNGVVYEGGVSLNTTAAGTNGQLLLGQTGVAPAWGTMSGDATISNTGVVTLANSGTTRSNLGIAIGTNVQAFDPQLTSNIPVNSQSAAYTLVLTDGEKIILHPSTDNNARTYTIPPNSSVAFPIGTAITFINMVNTVTLNITSDTLTQIGTGSTGTRTLAAFGMATAIKIGSTSWVISGNGLS